MSKLSTNDSKAVQKRHKCPKCGKYYVGYPALSRRDTIRLKYVRSVGYWKRYKITACGVDCRQEHVVSRMSL